MVQVSIQHSRALENRTPVLFLAAGGLLVLYGILNGMEAFLDMAYPAVQNVFGPAGFVCGLIGLLSVSSMLPDRHPVLIRVGSFFAALGAVGFSAIFVVNLGVLTEVLPAEPPGWTAVFVLLAAIGMIPGFFAFAIATLGTDAHPRRVCLLLLAPPGIFATMVLGASVGYTPAWSAFVISAGQAVAHLAIGQTFRNGLLRINREAASTEVATG